jgi:hypothetical protein
LLSLRYTYLDSFILDPEGIKRLSLRTIWNFAKEQGFLDPVSDYSAQRAYFKA